jgi:WD40 repeat protein
MSKIESKFPLLASLEGHHGSILCVAFHPSAPILATGCQDNSILLWDIDSDKPVVTLLGHTAAVECLAFHPSAPLLVSGGGDGKMMMWDTTTHQCLSTKDVYRLSPVSCVAFRPHLNGTEDFDMISGASRDLLKLWKISPDKKELILVDEVSPPSWSDYGGRDSKCIVFHPTQPRVATAALTGGSVFDIDPPRWGRPEKLSELMALDGRGKHRAQTSTIAFHPSAPIVVTGGNDKKIKLWELLTTGRKYAAAECVETLDDHDGDVTSVAFHPTVPVLFSCSRDRTIRVWYMAPDQMSAFCIDTLTAQSGFTSLTVHPSGRFFATGCQDGTTNLWDCSILNIDTQFKMARMRGLERDVIRGLIPPESMYGMRDPRGYLGNRVARRRTRRVMLLEHPSAKTTTAQENAVRLAELWAKSPKPKSPSPKPGSPKSPKPGSPSPKPGSPKSPKSDQRGSGGSMTRRRKKNSSRKVKGYASKTKHYRKLR